MEFATVEKGKKVFVAYDKNLKVENEGLLKPTIENVSLVAIIFFVGELLITKSGIPVLEMGINHLILFLVVVLVAVFKNHLDEKKEIY